MDRPKVSVITVCYNAQKTIEKTIRSVTGQDYHPLEYIVVDGLSNDGTMDIVNRYKTQIAKVISEKDSGIYEAMNKGIKAAEGKWLCFLNADDYLFHEQTVSLVMDQIAGAGKDSDVFYGKVLIYNEEDGKANIWQSAEADRFSLYRGALPHPAMFFKRSAFERAGLFNETFPISGDYEWTVRAFMKHGLRFMRIPCLVAVFNKGGVSTDPRKQEIIRGEKIRIRTGSYSPTQRAWYTFRWRIRKTFGI